MADDLGASGWDLDTGYGRINAYKALAMSVIPPVAHISSAKVDYAAKTITVSGSAYADGFLNYKLEYGSGNNPESWQTLKTSTTAVKDGIKVDTTPPSKPTVTDEGAYTNSTTALKASWTACSDLESGIAAYEYKITQDSVTGTVISNWTSTGTVLSVTASGLTLTQGKTYYFSVRSRNGAGLFSAIGYSDGIKVNTPPTAPIITSTDSGYVNISYNFTAQSTDAEGDPIHLSFIFLGTDGLEHLVAIWYNNPATQSYSWNKAGTYYIKVLAEDDKGGASTWTKKNILIQ